MVNAVWVEKIAHPFMQGSTPCRFQMGIKLWTRTEGQPLDVTLVSYSSTASDDD